MRSIGFTLLLTLAAAILCGMAGWQWQKGNFDSLFGAPATPVGQRIYASFTPDEVKHIQITAGHTSASFSLLPGGWQASSPWEDRMDPRAAVGIINFTLSMRVEDLAPIDKVDLAKSGLEENAVRIRLEDENHRPLAKYKLGRQTSWKAEFKDMDDPAPTVFIQPHDKSHKRYVYAATGDINPLFKDELKFLRDHRPFYFNPITLSIIRIRSQQGDLTLGREHPDDPWRIVKPLDLPTDPAAIKALIEGIYELQAIKVSNRSSVTLPSSDSAVKTAQIAIVPFLTESETRLDIYPPESPEAREARAIVSDRPDTVFDIPIKPEPGLVSLADLPLGVNDLRDPTLTHLNIPSLSAISIQSATSPEILITREPQRPWMVTIEGVRHEANEENLYSLLKAVTTERAIGFESDAATDFSPWGLDRPFLTLRFLARNNQGLELRFGIDSKGTYFVNRLGTPTVMRVDKSLVDAVAVRPYEWRHSRLWSVNRVNLDAIQITRSAQAPVLLKYKFIDESWRAEQNGKDLSASLDPVRANYMLSVLEGLKVSRWLDPVDEGAAGALVTPTLSITVIEKTYDEDDNFTGISIRRIDFAPASTAVNPGYYYGRLDQESHPFLINRETYQKLADGLFEQ